MPASPADSQAREGHEMRSNPAFLDRGHGDPVLAMWDQDGKQLFAAPPSFALELLHE